MIFKRFRGDKVDFCNVFSEMLKKVILDTICSVMVLPNKFPIRLTKKVSKEAIKVPNPKVRTFAINKNVVLIGIFGHLL